MADFDEIVLPTPVKHNLDMLINQMHIGTQFSVKIENEEWISLAKVFLSAVVSIMNAHNN